MKYASSPWIPFVDCLSSILVVMVAIVYLQLLQPHLKSNEDAHKAGVTPGVMCAELYWPDNIPVDIDLWGTDPSKDIIGYSNRNGKNMDLMRDDLGSDLDPAGKNYEIMCSRQLVKGHWTFNASFYGKRSTSATDIPVKLILNFPGNNSTAGIPIVKDGVLHEEGSEITLIDFDMDDKGKILKNSINTIFKPLRAAKAN